MRSSLRRSALTLLTSDRVGVLIATATAAVLGLLYLGDKSYWLDEGYTVAFTSMPWGRLFGLIAHSEPNMSLYYVALKVWMSLGHSEANVRSLSVIGFVSTVPVLAAIARRTSGGAAAVGAAGFFATNAFAIRYAQEARAYALLMLAVSGSALLLLRAIERPSRERLVAYAIVSATAVYLHVFALLVIGAHVATIVGVAIASGAHRPRAIVQIGDLAVARLIGAWAGMGVLLLPLAAFMHGAPGGRISWLPRPTILPSDARTPSLVGVLEDHAGNGGYVLLAIVLAFAAIGLVDAWRAWRGATSASQRLASALVPTWLILPVVATFVLSFVKPLFHPRFLLITVPALAVLVGRGIASARPRAAAAVGVPATIVLAVFALARWYGGFRNEDWRGAASLVVSSARPGDAIAFVPPRIRLPFEVYLDKPRTPLPAYPSTPWGSVDALTPQNADTTGIAAALSEVRASRVWLVMSHYEPAERATAIGTLDARYTLVSTTVLPAEQPITRRRFEPGIEIRLYERAERRPFAATARHGREAARGAQESTGSVYLHRLE